MACVPFSRAVSGRAIEELCQLLLRVSRSRRCTLKRKRYRGRGSIDTIIVVPLPVWRSSSVEVELELLHCPVLSADTREHVPCAHHRYCSEQGAWSAAKGEVGTGATDDSRDSKGRVVVMRRSS